MKPQILVTGVRESFSVTCATPLERLTEVNSSNSPLLTKGNKVERWLIFNDGAFELPCGEKEYEQLLRYLYSQQEPLRKAEVVPIKKLAVLPTLPQEVPEGAQVFSATDDPPPPPEEEEEDDGDDTDWAGETDDAEDGVGQL